MPHAGGLRLDQRFLQIAGPGFDPAHVINRMHVDGSTAMIAVTDLAPGIRSAALG